MVLSILAVLGEVKYQKTDFLGENISHQFFAVLGRVKILTF